MSWKVFIIPRLNKSVLESDRDLTLTGTTLKFTDIPGKPLIPDLTLDNNTTSPRLAEGTDDVNNSYTLKIFVDNPGVTPTPRFLGQLVKSNPAGQEWYDTILALPTSEVLPDTVSDYEGNITLTAPKRLLIDATVAGNISKTASQFKFTPKKKTQVTVSLLFDPSFSSNFFNNDFQVGSAKHQMGGRYVNRLTSQEHVIFGHIHWGSDLHGAGDKTDPFLAIQPPPPHGGVGS